LENKVIYETENFSVVQPGRPHISREDGGHLWIISKEHYTDRTEFPPKVAIEMIRLSQMVGIAYKKAMAEGGVDVARINYQENGNWAFRKGASYQPYFHLHIYGRTVDSKNQTWGQALVFPDPDTGCYEGLTRLTDEDVSAFVKYMDELKKSERFADEVWRL